MTWEESRLALHTKTDVQDELIIQCIFKLKNKRFKFKYFNKIGNTNTEYTKNHPQPVVLQTKGGETKP